MKPRRKLPYSGMSGFCLCFFVASCTTTMQSVREATPALIHGAISSKKADSPTQASRLRNIGIRINAAMDLNADANGRGLPTVIRLYKLRDHIGFLAAPDALLGAAQIDKQAIGADLIEVREMAIAPGQRLDITERLGNDAAYLGIVALFHSPTPQRWRFAFSAADAERTGITVGVHTCALTATKATPVGMSPNEAALLSPVKCK